MEKRTAWCAWQASRAIATRDARKGEDGEAIKQTTTSLTINGKPMREGDTFTIDGKTYEIRATSDE